MTDYVLYVEKKVATQECATPNKKIYLDFGNKLLNLFKRLNIDPIGQKKEKWQTAFEILGTTLARHHRVYGIKFVHPDATDYSMERCLIEPFTNEQKLERMQLYTEHERNQQA
jgi:hypothetical protein